MTCGHPPDAPEVLSPELVLVADEETARRARESLPEQPWLFVPNRATEAAEEVPPAAPPRPRSRRTLVTAGLVVLGLGVAGFVTESHWRGADSSAADGATAPVPVSSSTARSTTAPATVPTAKATTAPASTLAPTTATVKAKPKPKPAPTPAPPAATAKAKPKPTPAPATATRRAATTTKTQTRPPPPPAPTGFVPARTWTWAPSKGADAYEVVFYRDGKVVLQAHPKEARFVMAPGFRFRPGRYRWTVRALPAASPTTRIVDSSFVLTPAAAAAANGSSGG
jgi:hypothetical protein